MSLSRQSLSRVVSSDGTRPPASETALVLIDVINDLAFPEGKQLLKFALPMARKIARLKQRLGELGVPVIYANDNFGRWRSDFNKLIDHGLEESCLGKPVVELLKPAPDDFFVLKPKHSGFYCTSMDVLLTYLGVRKLILCGMSGNNCVLFTANDAYMRDFELIIPKDCIASNTKRENDYALAQMRTVLKADTPESSRLSASYLTARARRAKH